MQPTRDNSRIASLTPLSRAADEHRCLSTALVTTLNPESPDVRERVLRLFEAARQRKGQEVDLERFVAFLTQPPAVKGRRVADTFAGRNRLVRFIESIESEFGVCFTREEWERGFSLDEFVRLLEAKLAKPGQAYRLACNRLQEARRPDETVKVGVAVTVPFVALILGLPQPVVRVVATLLWAVITAMLLYLTVRHYRHYKNLVQRTRGGARLTSQPTE